MVFQLPETNSRKFPALRLTGARVARNAQNAARADIEIDGGRIRKLLPSSLAEDRAHQNGNKWTSLQVDLKGYTILPGLINAHDHLEFNLFPRLGSGSYPNYAEWARNAYFPERSPLREHLAVPKPVRLWWGGLKNLLCGVTTVCHHDPYEAEVFGNGFPVRVVERYGWAHSLQFHNDVAAAFRSTPPRAPFIIHLAEGTDEESQNEIFTLDRLGALGRQTVIVHGVGLTDGGRALLDERGASVVWCPTSNLFALGATLDGRWVSARRSVALGNDSALTGFGDLLDEIQAAYKAGGVSTDRMYSLVTSSAATVLGLGGGEGFIHPGARADLIAISSPEHAPAATLLASNLSKVELVMVSGKPRAVSPEMAERWPRKLLQGFEPIEIGGVVRLVDAPVKRLYQEARKRLRGEIRLAGKRVEV